MRTAGAISSNWRYDAPSLPLRPLNGYRDPMTELRTQTRGDYPHSLAIPTRWMDCDAYGHVNNVIYYAMMDQVVTEFILGAGVIAMGTSPSIGLCVESACQFYQSIEFPEIVEARLRIGHIGSKSVRYEIGLFRASKPHPVGAGHFVHVYVDRQTREPVLRTDVQRAALLPLFDNQGK